MLETKGAARKEGELKEPASPYLPRDESATKIGQKSILKNSNLRGNVGSVVIEDDISSQKQTFEYPKFYKTKSNLS